MEKERFGIDISLQIDDIVNCLVDCYNDIQEKGKESCYYKEYGNLQYLSMIIQQMQINHCNQIEQYPQLNSTETIMSDFSMLSDKVQEMDENYQDLQYQNNQLKKQIEKEKQWKCQFQQRILLTSISYRNELFRERK